MTNNIKKIVKSEVEKLLFSFGFSPTIVKLAQKTNDGTEKISCYKYNELYCVITICHRPTILGEIKDWILIEYADSLYEAERWMFDDGDMIPLDIPIDRIISELKHELAKVINSTV